MKLTMYDLSGIQSFIFSTSKLKEIIGASIIVSKVFFEMIPQIFGQGIDDWKQQKGFFLDQSKDKQIVYIGGGNALILYKSDEIEKNMTRQLKHKVYQETGGYIELCHGSVEITDKDKLSEKYQELMEQLEESKRCPTDTTTSRGLAINAYDNMLYESIIWTDDGYTAKSRYLKDKAVTENPKYLEQILKQKEEYTKSFETLAKDSRKNYIAIIHIDGNTMGKAISDFINKQEHVETGLKNLSEMSQEISGRYRAVLRETIEQIFKGSLGEEQIPFRPILADGDDITLLIKANKAFDFIECFIENLENKNNSFSKDFNHKFSVGIGMAFIPPKYPLNNAYNIAEECCKNAKKAAIKNNEVDKSSVDFHICYSNMTMNLAEYREQEFLLKDKQNLLKRPYIFKSSAKSNYESEFKTMLRQVNNADIGRNKWMRLREAHLKSIEDIIVTGKFIISRMDTDAKLAETLKTSLLNPFDQDGKAKLFDVLEVMDILAGGEQ